MPPKQPLNSKQSETDGSHLCSEVCSVQIETDACFPENNEVNEINYFFISYKVLSFCLTG